MSPARVAWAIVIALAAAPLGGCFDDKTEVVVVVDTDLKPTEYGAISLSVSGAFGSNSATFLPNQALPATLGVEPANQATEFTLSVFVWPPGALPSPGFGVPTTMGTTPIVVRKASHVAFSEGAQRMLFVPISGACRCQGTSCPSALTPACAELVSPALADFDPNDLPRLKK
ncbi:MAG TPA: hypothetical protein VHJ20_05820 [Polyangia bacterium]|nr:hypothetical protein [Polyangia bacterium]